MCAARAPLSAAGLLQQLQHVFWQPLPPPPPHTHTHAHAHAGATARRSVIRRGHTYARGLPHQRFVPVPSIRKQALHDGPAARAFMHTRTHTTSTSPTHAHARPVVSPHAHTRSRFGQRSCTHVATHVHRATRWCCDAARPAKRACAQAPASAQAVPPSQHGATTPPTTSVRARPCRHAHPPWSPPRGVAMGAQAGLVLAGASHHCLASMSAPRGGAAPTDTTLHHQLPHHPPCRHVCTTPRPAG